MGARCLDAWASRRTGVDHCGARRPMQHQIKCSVLWCMVMKMSLCHTLSAEWC